MFYVQVPVAGPSSSEGSMHVFQGAAEARQLILIRRSELPSFAAVGPILSIAFNVTSLSGAGPARGLSVRMAHTFQKALSSTVFPNVNTLVYSGNYTLRGSWNTINFQTPFMWDGSSNLMISLCFSNAGSADAVAAALTQQATSYRSSLLALRSLGASGAAGCSLSPGRLQLLRPELRIDVTTLLPTTDYYECACDPGFTGSRCETNFDECASMPCENGGTCTDAAAGYECLCSVGFSGLHCEVDFNECLSEPCQNGGHCIQGDVPIRISSWFDLGSSYSPSTLYNFMQGAPVYCQSPPSRN
jgi:hypothetical protein